MPTTQPFDPYAQEAEEIARRRRYAEMLREQAGQPIQPAKSGNMTAPISWTQGLAKMVQGYSAGQAGRQADEESRVMRDRVGQERSRAIAEALRAGGGSPAIPSPADELGGGPGAPAVQGDPRAVYRSLAQSQDPMLMQIGLQGALPRIPKEPEPFTLSPGAGRFDAQGRPIAKMPDKAPQQAPSNLDRLLRERSALPPGDPRIATYDNAIRKESETAKQISPTIVMPKEPKNEQIIQTAEGPMRLVNGQAVPITGPSGQPVKPSSGRAGPMSATAQRELIETEEQLQGGQQALSFIKQAKAVNDKAMGFTGASAMASAGSLLPEAIRPGAVDATMELTNVIQNVALPQLKQIFGGMPTEGERKILLEMQGSASQPPKVRKGIFDRAEQAVNARLKFSQEKAKRLREGSYFTGEGLPSIGGPPATAGYAGPERRAGSDDPLGIRKK